MAGHIATAARTDWATPPGIVHAVQATFGGIPDLDPCWNSGSPVRARRMVQLPEDGLEIPWTGQVYVNPPFGKGIEDWIEKAAMDHVDLGAEVVLLVPAAVSARYWHELVVRHARRVCFIRGRLRFVGAPSSAPFATAIVYYGDHPKRFEVAFGDRGWIVVP